MCQNGEKNLQEIENISKQNCESGDRSSDRSGDRSLISHQTYHSCVSLISDHLSVRLSFISLIGRISYLMAEVSNTCGVNWGPQSNDVVIFVCLLANDAMTSHN